MKKSLSWIVLAVLALSVLSACGGGGGGGAAGVQPPSAQLGGTWQWTEVEGANTCGDYPDPNFPAPDSLWTGIVTHATGSNNLSVLNTTANPDETYAGTISGSSISVSGLHSTGTGTATFSFTGTVHSSGTIVSGTSSWTWAGSGPACSGTTQVVAGLGTGSVRIMNNSALTVTQVYLAPTISNFWGSNRIVANIPTGGGTATISSITPGYYDFLAIMSDSTGRGVTFTLPAGPTPTVTITIPN